MMIRSSIATFSLAFLNSLALVACHSRSESTDDLEAIPEVAAVQMSLTGDTASEATANEDDAIDASSMAADELEQASVPETTDANDLGQVRHAVKELNQSIRDFLAHVAALVRNEEPSHELGALRIWGPVTRGATEYRFILRHATARRWGWRLDARLAGSTESFDRVAAGEITVKGRARRGSGLMGFDLDALSAVDPTVVAQGQILAGFRHGDLGTTVGYALRDFTRDPAVRPGLDAILRAVHSEQGVNRVRLAFRDNVEGTATAAEELVLARVRHQRDAGGRSDFVVVQGDVPTGTALVVSQCWNQQLQSGYRIVRSCPLDGLGGESCTVTVSSGDANTCPVSFRSVELPPVDPNAPMPEQDDPNADVAAPSEIPSVEGAETAD